MSGTFHCHTVDDRAIELRHEDRVAMRYVFRPETPADESPRPYAHPIATLAGAELTNFRPNDHRWHHGLSLTLSGVSGVNFWGGGTYRKADGYQWRNDHGEQRHVTWLEQGGARLVEAVEWRAGPDVLLREERVLTPAIDSANAWTLHWRSQLKNVSGRELVLTNYHSAEGLAGSHYTGLQFRGARDLLDDHGDAGVGVFAEGGLAGEAAVHGASARWMEWRGQKDVTLGRVVIRFANGTGPIRWFMRRGNPLAAFAFHHDRNVVLPPGGTLVLDHALSFIDAS